MTPEDRLNWWRDLKDWVDRNEAIHHDRDQVLIYNNDKLVRVINEKEGMYE